MTNTTNTTADALYRKPSRFLVSPLYSNDIEYYHQGINRHPPEPYDTAEQAEAAALAMAQRLFCRVQILSLYAVVEARPEIVKQNQ
jgi:hypothetical protein